MYITKWGFCSVLLKPFSLFSSALNLAEMAVHVAGEKEMLVVVST